LGLILALEKVLALETQINLDQVLYQIQGETILDRILDLETQILTLDQVLFQILEDPDLLLGRQLELVYWVQEPELWDLKHLVPDQDSAKILLVLVSTQPSVNPSGALEVIYLEEKRAMELRPEVMEQIGEQTLVVGSVNMVQAKRDSPKKLLDWESELDFLVEQHWGLLERWLLMAQSTSIKNSKTFCMEEEDTTIQEGMIMIGMMIDGAMIGIEKITGIEVETMIEIETITVTTMKKMNATKAAQLTLTVSGVFVNVTMDISRNGVDVKMTGEQFHKHKFNR